MKLLEADYRNVTKKMPGLDSALLCYEHSVSKRDTSKIMTNQIKKDGHQIISPLTGGDVKILDHFDIKWIVSKWKNHFSYDVSGLFAGHTELLLCECQDTHYKFFFPAIVGDAKLYAHLGQYNWYYMPWKWEHEASLHYIKNGMKVLEIGCGQGGFMSSVLKRKHVDVSGLELNEGAVRLCRTQGLKVFEQDVGRHAATHAGAYDMVCMFQVLEHVYDIKPFLANVIECVKPGGAVVISVPNNDSFVGASFGVLNAPPHHVGLWDRRALYALTDIFDIDLIMLQNEPLQTYHFGNVQGVIFNKLTRGYRILKMLYCLLGYKIIINKSVESSSSWLIGHSMLAVYVRRSAGSLRQ